MITVASRPNGIVRCGLPRLGGGGRDRVEADVGEEDDAGGPEDAGDAVVAEAARVVGTNGSQLAFEM